MTEIERLTQERDDALLAMSALRDAWSAVHDGEHGNAAWMLGCAQAFAATPAALAGQVRARVLHDLATSIEIECARTGSEAIVSRHAPLVVALATAKGIVGTMAAIVAHLRALAEADLRALAEAERAK